MRAIERGSLLAAKEPCVLQGTNDVETFAESGVAAGSKGQMGGRSAVRDRSNNVRMMLDWPQKAVMKGMFYTPSFLCMPYHNHGPPCPSIESIVCTLVKKPCNSLAHGSHMLGRLGCLLAFVRGVMPLLPLRKQMSPGAHLRYTCTLSWLARWLTHRASSSTLHRLICSCTRPHGTSSRALFCRFQVDYNCLRFKACRRLSLL
jgi:hypothetical protein